MGKSMEIKLICDTRERKIQDNINAEFAAPLVFAKSAKAGKIKCEVRQIEVGDYIITSGQSDAQIPLAIIERKSLTDYAASFKDGRHTNKTKLLNFSSITGCRIYYVIEGPLNPEYDTEFSGIKFQNIQASIHDLMIEHGIIILRTQNGAHTAKELKMLCESYLRVSADLAKSTRKSTDSADLAKPIHKLDELVDSANLSDKTDLATAVFAGDAVESSDTPCQYVNPIDQSDETLVETQNRLTTDPPRHAMTFEEALKKSVFTPEEKMIKDRVSAWETLPRIGKYTAAKLASEFTLSDWILGKLDQLQIQGFAFNGRKNNVVSNLLNAKPSIEMQVGILAKLNGFGDALSAELLSQISLEDILLDKPSDHVRLGNRKTRLTTERKAKIKLFLSGKNA